MDTCFASDLGLAPCLFAQGFCPQCEAGEHCLGHAECACGCPVCFWEGSPTDDAHPPGLHEATPQWSVDPRLAPLLALTPCTAVRTWSEQVGVQSQTQARPETGAPPASASLPAVDPPHAPLRNHQPSLAIPAGGARASIQPADPAPGEEHPDLCASAPGTPTQTERHPCFD